MRRLLPLLVVAVLGNAATGAPLDAKAWTAIETELRALAKEPGQGERKVALFKSVAQDGTARASKVAVEAVVAEAGHWGKAAAEAEKTVGALQAGLGKRTSEMFPADLEEMRRLQQEVSRLERLRAEADRTIQAYVAAAGGSTADFRKALLVAGRASLDWGVRAVAARIAVAAPEEAPSKAALADSLDKEKDPRVKLAALVALSSAAGSWWRPLIVGRIEDPDWGVQVVAARLAGQREVGTAIPPLVRALATASPRVATEVVLALEKLTGERLGTFAEPWAKWWEENRSKWGDDGRPLAPIKGSAKPGPEVTFYGIQVKSNRVLFVLDISGSMKEEKKPPPPPPAGPRGEKTGDAPPSTPPPEKFGGRKIDVAKQELKKAVKALPKEASFGIVAFNHAALTWQTALVLATEANKELAFAWIRDMEPAGSTFIDGALRTSFKIAGIGATDAAYNVAVDTIFLLSDGAPTDNSYPESKDMDPKEILAHVREWNSGKRIVVNCIGIDNVVQGIQFLKDLAAENGGVYVDG